MDTNPSPLKIYSLRPRGARRPDALDLGENKPCRTKRKPRTNHLSKYRRRTANARERSRMREINEAFETLRRVIPQITIKEASGEKITKISTLRLAMKYITVLNNILQDQDVPESETELLEEYTLSLTPPDSEDGPPTLNPPRDAQSVCSAAPLPLSNPFVPSSFVFDDSYYLLEDVPLLMSEFG